MDVFGERPMI